MNTKKGIGTIFLIKLFLSILLTLIILILIKSSTSFKHLFYKYVYDNNFSFTYATNLYKKYIGDTNLFNKYIKTETVFNEKLTYNNIYKYLDGACLDVSSNYLVPTTESGIVVFIGEKEGYNNTVIVQRIDGIDEWYGNVNNVNVELYDYVKKGSLIGEADKKLYMVFKKDGDILNYEEYIK